MKSEAKGKHVALVLLLVALSGVVGYQIGYSCAPRVQMIELVQPPSWRAGEVERI